MLSDPIRDGPPASANPGSELSNQPCKADSFHADDPPPALGGLRILSVSGTAAERGVIHGSSLREEIGRCLDAYRSVWRTLPAVAIEALVDDQRRIIEGHFPEIAEEICGIARGAGIAERDIFALNGRTEITLLNYHAHSVGSASRFDSCRPPTNECTLIGSTKTGVLGENWDWARSIEKITFLNLTTGADGRRFLSMTEPGIVAKIGMNSDGLALGLNFIPGVEFNRGVPVHVLLRAAFELRSVEELGAMLERLQRQNLLGTCSAISAIDRFGVGEMFEILGTDLVRAKHPNDATFAHTNHMNLDPGRFKGIHSEDSEARLADAYRMLGESDLTVERASRILADRSSKFAINMPPANWGDIGEVETIRTVIFDLSSRRMLISQGSPGSADRPLGFDSITL